MRVDTEVGTGMTGRSPDPGPIVEHVYVFPVTFAQQRLLFLNQLDPTSTSYSVPWSIRISGKLNAVALERSLNEIVRRHEILRTTFDIVEGQPVQIVSPTLHIPLAYADISALPDPEQEAQTAATTEAQTPVDLKNGPLVRAKLICLGQEDHVLLLTMHHIIFDGWSRRILVAELAALYGAFCAGLPSPLEELPLQYPDYAVWQRNYLKGPNLEKLLNYWKQQLAGAPTTLDLPTDRPRPPVQSFRGAAKSLSFPKALSEEVARASRRFGVTPFMLLLAGFQILLSRYSGQNDVLVGAVIANRNRAEVEGLIGLFANTVPMRTKLEGDPTFHELLERVKDTALGAYAHQDMPFDRLVEELRPERSLSYNPLFQVVFSMQTASRRAFELSGLQLQPLGGVVGATAKFDLSFFLLEGADGLSGRIEYNTDLFDATTIDRMLSHYLVLLEAAVADPETRVSQLPLLTVEERQQILIEWNATEAECHRERSLHQFVEEQVERTPHATAVVFESQSLTYRELNARANQLAHRLRTLGAGPEELVAICSERSLEMVVGLLGIMKAGAAYVPIDPEHPRSRLAVMLEDAEPRVLLTQEHLLAVLPEHSIPTLCLDRDWRTIAAEPDDNPRVLTSGKDQAYMIYTSGSTGKPKGVPNVHEGIVNRLLWMQDAFRLDSGDRVLQKTPYSFDVSVWEFFWPLMTGACLVVARPEGHKDPSYLVDLIIEQKITTMHFVPSMLQIFLEAEGVERCVSLRRVICSGEALSLELQQRFFQALQAELHNLYGPTEAAVDVSSWRCSDNSGRATVPIGKPIWNTQLYILDKYLHPVPVGVPGELHIGGINLARGYWKQPELTSQKFIPDPFGQEPGARIYKTGDLTRFLPDGNIEYLGRIDHQVKLRGFRIELGEIETVLSCHPSVENVVVVVREDRPGDKKLVAYIVPVSGQGLNWAELRSHLEQSVPGYMVPGAFVELEALPLTSSGKINRSVLPAPDRSHLDVGAKTGPRDQLELILIRTWERVLGVSNIGVDDNFFDLGGHSLLAVRLLSEVEKVVGRKLPLAILFRGSTVAALAKLLHEGSESDPEPLVVEFQAGIPGSPPFFAVAAPGVRAIGYGLLARHLGVDQGFYKLQAQGPVVKDRPLNVDELRSLAKQYVAAMRAIQPEGPYYLSAMCGGCGIAEQMILQLEAHGLEVGLFAVFDTWVQEHAQSRWRFLLFNYHQRLRWLRTASARERLDWIKCAVINRIRNWTGKAKAPRPWIEAYFPENFRTPHFHAPVVLFKSPKQPYFHKDDQELGWGARSARAVEIHAVDAIHHDILRDPHLQFVSKILLSRMHPTKSHTEAASANGAVEETMVQTSIQ